MSNKLKCPFCGEELKQTSFYMDGNSRFSHKYIGALEGGKDRCPLDGETLHYRGWQALIQAKQDLEIAVGALRNIGASNNRVTNLAMQKIAHKTLNQIEHKE